MQGWHVFDPTAVLAVDLESLVHQDHLLRKVEWILETSFIRELTAACYASGVGRPSIDPEVFSGCFWWPLKTMEVITFSGEA